MTRKISLITAVAIAAMTVGAPAAFGEGRLAGSPQPTLATPDPMIEDGFAQAVAAQTALWMAEDGFDRAVAVANQLNRSATVRPSDSVDGARAESSAFRLSDSVDGALAIANPLNDGLVASTTSSGNEVEWPQIGIGVGLGIILVLGLGLAMRATRIRPLAH